jgi:hypothetical protein
MVEVTPEEKARIICQGLSAIDQICYALRSLSDILKDEHLRTVAVDIQNKLSVEARTYKCEKVWSL